MDDSDKDSGFEESIEERKAASPLISSSQPVSRLQDTAVSPSIPLSGFTHSLAPDMAFGWRPSNLKGSPIPLYFNRCDFPLPVSSLSHENFPALYNGLRPRDTLILHQAVSKGGYVVPAYSDYEAFEFMKRRDRGLKDERPFVGMRPGADAGLVFDSSFECGNLDKVVQVAEHDFELYIRPDANTAGYFLWYYFTVQTQSKRTVRLHLMNFTKSEGLYAQGMQPLVYVEQMPAWGWHRAGDKVKFGESGLNRRKGGKRAYFSLSFSYTFRFPGEKAFFAYSVPYPYSYLLKTIADLGRSSFVHKDVIGRTLSGVEIPALTVTNFSTGDSKPHIVLLGRLRPWESFGSWMLHVRTKQGVMKFLTSAAPSAAALRDRAVFVFIPMANPDGVILGNSRTSLSGDDLSRAFEDPEVSLHPEITAIKEAINRLSQAHSILLFLSFHSHSKKKHIFLHGPHHPLHSRKYYPSRILPKLICDQGPQFRYKACRFCNEERGKGGWLQPPRTVVAREWGVGKSYAVFGSAFGYWLEDRSTVAFTHQSMEDTGQRICEAILQHFLLKETIKRKRAARRGFRRYKQKAVMVDLSGIPSPLPGPAGRDMEDVIEQIKASEEAGDPSLSDSSSDSDLDALPPEDQQFIHTSILTALHSPHLPKSPIVRIRQWQAKPKESSRESSEEPVRDFHRPEEAPARLVFSRVRTDKLLRGRLMAPLATAKVLLDVSPDRAVSALRPVRTGKQGWRDRSEGKGAGLKCPQRGYRQEEGNKAETLHISPLRVDKVEGLWTRRSNLTLKQPLSVLRPLQHENGAATERTLEKSEEWRPPVPFRAEAYGSLPRLS